MRTSIVAILPGLLISLLISCHKEITTTKTTLSGYDTTYFDREVFSENDLKIYGKWKLDYISGGIHGQGTKNNFDYLVIKKYGIYYFVKNDSILEYGKISPVVPNTNGLGLDVNIGRDPNSGTIFFDPEKFAVFEGPDTLYLRSPCCDRYDYSFTRTK